VGSRPTSLAGTVSPLESVTAKSPSSDKASSAVTMSPGMSNLWWPHLR
jgi:hypothetical protein